MACSDNISLILSRNARQWKFLFQNIFSSGYPVTVKCYSPGASSPISQSQHVAEVVMWLLNTQKKSQGDNPSGSNLLFILWKHNFFSIKTVSSRVISDTSIFLRNYLEGEVDNHLYSGFWNILIVFSDRHALRWSQGIITLSNYLMLKVGKIWGLFLGNKMCQGSGGTYMIISSHPSLQLSRLEQESLLLSLRLRLPCYEWDYAIKRAYRCRGWPSINQ